MKKLLLLIDRLCNDKPTKKTTKNDQLNYLRNDAKVWRSKYEAERRRRIIAENELSKIHNINILT